MIEKALFKRLSEDAGVLALVGARIYPRKAPPKPPKPYVTYFTVVGDTKIDHSGTTGFAESLFQFSAWSTDELEALNIREKIRISLAGRRITVDLGGGNNFEFAVLEFEDIAQPPFEDATKLYQVPCQARIWHQQATS